MVQKRDFRSGWAADGAADEEKQGRFYAKSVQVGACEQFGAPGGVFAPRCGAPALSTPGRDVLWERSRPKEALIKSINRHSRESGNPF
ncbi:MAG: hypothetical protein WCR74_21620 [Betaproteobacteria bacterium]